MTLFADSGKAEPNGKSVAWLGTVQTALKTRARGLQSEFFRGGLVLSREILS